MNETERQVLARLADLVGEVAAAVEIDEAAGEAFNLAQALRDGLGNA